MNNDKTIFVNSPIQPLEHPYICDENAKRQYDLTCVRLLELEEAGKLHFDADDSRIPFPIHFIRVEWATENDGDVNIATEELTRILGLLDGNIFYRDELGCKWHISVTIYSKFS